MFQDKKTVFVAMSGGVDSSVAALLLKNRGYEVVGVFILCWSGDGPDASVGVNCAWERDAEDARRVAEKLGIPFYVWDFEKEYKKRVVDYMVEGYRRGITPNPDVMCNKEIKFGLFLKRALEAGADYAATGHYVRVEENFAVLDHASSRPARDSLWSSRVRSAFGGDQAEPAASVSNSKVFYLFTARDAQKDQSYFLWTLTQEQLKHCLFPIGDYLKSEVREMARKAGLPTAEKKDSQGICFLGRVRLDDFLRQYIEPKVGQVRLALNDGSYEVVGEHRGSAFYTIGQRHIGLSNLKSHSANRGAPQPVYVAQKDPETNTIVVAEGRENPALYQKEVALADVNFINPSYSNILQNVGMCVLARVRYRQPLAKAKLEIRNETCPPKPRRRRESEIKLIFDEPQKFVAPGQSAVIYSQASELLGGGIIA